MLRSLAILLLAAAAAHRLPAQSYDLIDLGGAAGTWSGAYGINEAGQVAGDIRVSIYAWDGFRWENGVTTLLPPPPGAYFAHGTGINGAGVVVGFEIVGRALVWSGGAAHVIGGLGGTYHSALAVNDAGQVVGWSQNSIGRERAFVWQGGVMADLGTLGGDTSEAYAINQAGQVAGKAALGVGETHAFLWDGVMHDLGTLGGRLAAAYGMNDNGLTVGGSWVAGADVREHAFLRNAVQMIDLGTLEGPDGESRALDVNNVLQVVGHSTFPGSTWPETHAFLYQDGTLQDLNDLIPAGTGWVLEAATGINDAGRIAGYGQNGGVRRAFLLEPTATSLHLTDPVPGSAGVLNTWTISNCTPGETEFLAYGVHAGSARLPGCPGVTLEIERPNTVPPLIADPAGVASFSATVSASTAGRTVRFQAAELSNCRVSNLVAWTFR